MTVVDQLADVWEALAELGGGLSDAEWAAPTECPGWSVHDHVAHVVGTEAMLLGRAAPPPAPAAPHVRNPLGEMNEAWVAQWRLRPSAELLDELRAVTAARLRALSAMTDEELSAPTASPIGQVPYATFMAVRVMDCWVHEQDIRQATGRPWRLTGPAAAAAVDRLDGSFGYVVGKRVAPPEGTRVTLQIEGPLARTLAVQIAQGRAVPVPPGEPDAGPSARIGVTAPTYVRLVTGRLDPAHAVDEGLVALSGDADLGRRVVDHLATVP